MSADPITRQQLAAELTAAVRSEGYEAGAHYLEAEGSFGLDNGQMVSPKASVRRLSSRSSGP